MNRIIKKELIDEQNHVVSVTAFTRFGCNQNGSKTGFIILRTVGVIGLTSGILIDWGVHDWIAHIDRQPNDGDKMWYWLRPENLIHLFVLVYLCVALHAATLKRKESDNHAKQMRKHSFT